MGYFVTICEVYKLLEHNIAWKGRAGIGLSAIVELALPREQ